MSRVWDFALTWQIYAGDKVMAVNEGKAAFAGGHLWHAQNQAGKKRYI